MKLVLEKIYLECTQSGFYVTHMYKEDVFLSLMENLFITTTIICLMKGLS